jgi:hypothetical protein
MNNSWDITNENIHCQMLSQMTKMGKLNLIEDILFLLAFISFLRENLIDPNKKRKDLHQFREMTNNERHALNPSTYED